MYTAGHLWHYIFVYYLHMSTRWAMHIWKIATILIHTAIILTVLRIAKVSFRSNTYKVQLIGVILATNWSYHTFSTLLYNDLLL